MTLPPHMAGLTTKALVIAGPIKRQATIELEPSVKGFLSLIDDDIVVLQTGAVLTMLIEYVKRKDKELPE
jgi:hypothetical protein